VFWLYSITNSVKKQVPALKKEEKPKRTDKNTSQKSSEKTGHFSQNFTRAQIIYNLWQEIS
jgi:hypothetical protein